MNEVASRALGEDPDRGFDSANAPHSLVDFMDTAEAHKDAGLRVPPGTRFRSLKNLLVRLLRLQTTEQAAYNRAVLAALHSLSRHIGLLEGDIDQRLGRTQVALSNSDLMHEDLQRRQQEGFAQVTARLAELQASLADTAERLVADRSDIAVLRARMEIVLGEARRRLPEPFDREQIERIAGDEDASLAPLYGQLEDAFRGSREHVLEAQKEYLADVVTLPVQGPVVDVGCGRGEWLELLQQHEIPAYGLDTNEVFVEANVARGLDVRLGDAVEYLTNLEPSSIAALTGFHIVEHLEFPDVVRLIDAALVAIRPGGVLIFETPNPTNIVVGSSSFYLDPTHRNPVHPMFLQFLIEARGFVEVEVRYLHPLPQAEFSLTDPDPETRRLIEHLNWAFFGPQDYAVIARKAKPGA